MHDPDTTRRALVGGLVASAGAAVLPGSPAQAEINPPARVAEWLIGPGAEPFDIPLDYLGLHSDHGVSGRVRPPSYPYDAIRSHDVDNGRGLPATQWADIETAPGHYDWRRVDHWINTHPDKTRIWVLFGTPRFYQKYPNEAFPFPHLPGGGSPPRDPQTAANFISALLKRHPGKINFVEIWNEPNFGPGTDPKKDRWTPSIGEPGWFTGTASELAEMARLVREILPPDVKLMAAGWAWQAKDGDDGPSNSVLRFASAPDGKGGKGKDSVQALSVHLYTYRNDPNETIKELKNYDKLFVKCGYPRTMERYVTETGAWDPGKFTATSPSMADKVRNVKRWCMIPAAMRYRGVYLYKHSTLDTLGDPARNPPIADAITEMRNGLRGKRLVRSAVLSDETLWLQFADGSTLRA